MSEARLKCRVVIIDDDGDIRALLRIFLERAGAFEVVGEGGNGREGVEVAAAVAPDVVLLDISMPVLDGLQALPLIKAAVPGANVVMLTGLDDPDVRGHAFAAGADGFVPKTSDINSIVTEATRACKGTLQAVS